jgi:hypothetical protein
MSAPQVNPYVTKRKRKWIGVDLDGTLAYYEDGHTYKWIGPPIPEMVKKV